MDQPAPTTQRQEFARTYWDARAQGDLLYSLWGDAAVAQGHSADVEAFARSGEADARALLPYVHPDAVVLEIGCGIGRLLRPVARHCKEAIGIDVSGEMIARAEAFLAEVPNARAVVNDGATLAGIEDESVDFVYSLLCLIHVDKRSAFRYLREIRRVLKPNGRALLQFQNILSPRGFEQFQSVLESDYPFEFYTPEELRFLLRSTGLEVHTEKLNNEFIEVAALRGRVDGWMREWRQGFKAEDVKRTGSLAPTGGDLDADGEAQAIVVNDTDAWRTCEFAVSLHRRSAGRLKECCFASGVLFTPPKSRTRVRAAYDGSNHDLTLSSPGRFVADPTRRSEPFPDVGRVELHLAITPSGFPWNEDTVRLFPSLGAAWTLTEPAR